MHDIMAQREFKPSIKLYSKKGDLLKVCDEFVNDKSVRIVKN